MFWNEDYIIDDYEDNFIVVDTIYFSDISFYIKPGENILAFRVTDFDNTAGGIKIFGRLTQKGASDHPTDGEFASEHVAGGLADGVKLIQRNHLFVGCNLKYAVRRGVNG